MREIRLWLHTAPKNIYLSDREKNVKVCLRLVKYNYPTIYLLHCIITIVGHILLVTDKGLGFTGRNVQNTVPIPW